ncbi:MAG: tyramine oxidase subunit B [Eggerthellaceae bacterium]|jgi:ornithine cyclodeaminase/alanine dehydrogenase-like protein (mu-crystallin family)
MSDYPEVDFLYLSEPDMIEAGVTDVLACTDCMEEVVKLLDIGDYRMGGENGNSHGCMIQFPKEELFPGMPVDGPDRRFMCMPAYLGGSFAMAGVKWYGSNVENRKLGLPRSILMVTLNDKDTGAPVAHMSANLLSAHRTAAIPGVGVKHLARQDAKVLGIVGPGFINSITIKTFAALRPTLDTLKIKGRGRASIDRCIAYVKENVPQFKNIVVCDTLEECVRDSDILSFATSTPTGGQENYPFFEPEWVKPGALLCGMGAMNTTKELIADPSTKLVVDNMGLYDAWAEEYPYPTFDTWFLIGSKFTDMIHDGELTRDRIENIGAICAGKAPGRASDDQIIIYSIGGMPVEDVAWGKTVYEKAVEKGIGTRLKLWDKPYLY